MFLDKSELWPIEKRVLEYLDQHGPTHREKVVNDLSGRRFSRGSNGNCPRLMGAWCRRLEKAGLVKHVRSDDTWWAYRHHTITDAGRRLIRT